MNTPNMYPNTIIESITERDAIDLTPKIPDINKLIQKKYYKQNVKTRNNQIQIL